MEQQGREEYDQTGKFSVRCPSQRDSEQDEERFPRLSDHHHVVRVRDGRHGSRQSEILGRRCASARSLQSSSSWMGAGRASSCVPMRV